MCTAHDEGGALREKVREIISYRFRGEPHPPNPWIDGQTDEILKTVFDHLEQPSEAMSKAACTTATGDELGLTFDDVGDVWRAMHASARKEAQDKGLPLLVEVGTEDCFYCRKLDATTFRDPAVTGLLAGGFVPLRVDANREPALAKALKVQVYPTVVLAGPDGKIHAFIEGYLEADRLSDQLKRTVTAATTADWAARDFEQATKALAAGEYSRAVTLLKGITREQGTKPVGVKAQQVLDDVERQAAGRLARAKEFEQRGQTQEALDTLADAVKTYAGTQAAADAATLMTGLTARPEAQDKLRGRAARDCA